MSVQPATSVGGENYGWSVMEGTFCHDPAPPGCAVSPPTCSDPSYAEPIHDYTHAAGDCSVIGGFVYRGSDVPALVGRYVFGDYCTGNVWAPSEDPPGQWTRELLAVAGFGVTSLGHDANGELYLTRGNEVLRIAPADAIPAAAPGGAGDRWPAPAVDPGAPQIAAWSEVKPPRVSLGWAVESGRSPRRVASLLPSPRAAGPTTCLCRRQLASH